MEVSVVELRHRMREVLRAVDRGERVTITFRGKPRAMLGPVEGPGRPRMRVVDHPAFGMWKDREDMEDVDAYVRKLRRGRQFDL